MVEVWSLNPEQQDNLWDKDTCPFCGAKIVEMDLTVDEAYWVCYYCDTQFICE
jgi:transcription elongation factor Elf1